MIVYDVNTAAIMSAGMELLRQNLGVVETEIFIVNLKSRSFDYTQWRQTQPWYNYSANKILDEAAQYEIENPPLFKRLNLHQN